MRNEDFKYKGIVKVINAKDRELLEFIAIQMFYNLAKSTDDWEIAYDSIIVKKENNKLKERRKTALKSGKEPRNKGKMVYLGSQA